jgi:hypothetical protein
MTHSRARNHSAVRDTREDIESDWQKVSPWSDARTGLAAASAIRTRPKLTSKDPQIQFWDLAAIDRAITRPRSGSLRLQNCSLINQRLASQYEGRPP